MFIALKATKLQFSSVGAKCCKVQIYIISFLSRSKMLVHKVENVLFVKGNVKLS